MTPTHTMPDVGAMMTDRDQSIVDWIANLRADAGCKAAALEHLEEVYEALSNARALLSASKPTEQADREEREPEPVAWFYYEDDEFIRMYDSEEKAVAACEKFGGHWDAVYKRPFPRTDPTAQAAVPQDERGALLADYVELNMSNYDPDDVDELNAWGIRAYDFISRAPSTPANVAAAAPAQSVEQTETSSLPVEQSALNQSIAELEFLSFTDDRGLTQSESESMSLVTRELKRLMTSRENAFDVALDAISDYQRNWDTGLPAEYASAERTHMECAVEAVREALTEFRAALQSPSRPNDSSLPCDHNYINGGCITCGCISAGE